MTFRVLRKTDVHLRIWEENPYLCDWPIRLVSGVCAWELGHPLSCRGGLKIPYKPICSLLAGPVLCSHLGLHGWLLCCHRRHLVQLRFCNRKCLPAAASLPPSWTLGTDSGVYDCPFPHPSNGTSSSQCLTGFWGEFGETTSITEHGSFSKSFHFPSKRWYLSAD